MGKLRGPFAPKARVQILDGEFILSLSGSIKEA
jgi:hypothetical protein